MERRRKYDREFKIEAVRLVTEDGRKATEVARNLGIHVKSVSHPLGGDLRLFSCINF